MKAKLIESKYSDNGYILVRYPDTSSIITSHTEQELMSQGIYNLIIPSINSGEKLSKPYLKPFSGYSIITYDIEKE